MNQNRRRQSKRRKARKARATYGTAKQVRERYGGISDMTLWRWLRDPNLQFPKPIVINGRRYWRWDKLDAFDDAQAASMEVT